MLPIFNSFPKVVLIPIQKMRADPTKESWLIRASLAKEPAMAAIAVILPWYTNMGMAEQRVPAP